MKLTTFLAPGHEAPFGGLLKDNRALALGTPDMIGRILAGGPVPDAVTGSWPLSEVTLLAPITAPGTIYAAGLNYAMHAAESGVEPPVKPLIFTKGRCSVAPPGGPVRRPSVVSELDYEGELVLVMGPAGKIAGYCIANDVSARDLQRSEMQWSRAKGADTFCPLGPWITTADEIDNADDLRLETWVNGELRQNSRTSEQIFDCQELIAFISETCTLQTGDLILTGTPEGIGSRMNPPQFLQPSDRVRIAIEGLGEIEHVVQ